MPDKKLTDNEIVKALECCTNNKCHTDGCPLIGATGCMGTLTGSALDLINRQKAEIERLQNKVVELSEVLSDTIRIRYAECRAEAVKEFAEKLKDAVEEIPVLKPSGDCVINECIKTIHNLVKETLGKL